ncbi:hypothetical protein H7K13_23705 [Priestia aryabhattai]|uniref:hypothetical protein n=1 Tax=Priestia aryabhattai TaxID=412384 RepID=UPI001C8EB88B|nr:hypothetical protein [Priestia aryabhattai]MBY0077936.1 hypothetical protein [Priestia aryabhattai]
MKKYFDKPRDYSVLFDFGPIEFKVYFWELAFYMTEEELHEAALKKLKDSGVNHLPEESYIYEVNLESC